MNCFFDTSALIKKYIAERGSDVVKSYLNHCIQLASALVPKQKPDYFLGADKKLNACASIEGLVVINPNEFKL
jgi:hypothetical protein